MIINLKMKHEKSWRFVEQWLTNRFGMLIFSTHRKIRDFMVCNLPGKSCHQMDQSMRQTHGQIKFLHPFYNWLETVLSCEKLCYNASFFFRMPMLQVIWRTQNQRQGECCVFRKRLFQQAGHAKKETAAPHSDTETEIISWDAGLRLEGIPALTLRDLVIDVVELWHRAIGRTTPKAKRRKDNRQHRPCSSSSAQLQPTSISCRFWRQWCGDQDDHRRPESDHETHLPNSSCEKEWLLNRMNLYPGIWIKQICYHSKQIADTLTKGSFTCER